MVIELPFYGPFETWKKQQKNNMSEVHTSNGIDISNTVRRNPKLVSTCHYCKIKKVTKKVKCKNKKCNVEICKSCLTELGEDVERALRNSKWLCPVCRNACHCKSCSMSMKKVLAKKEKEYLVRQDLTKKVKKKLNNLDR